MRSATRQHVSADTAAWVHRFCDRVIVVSRYDNRITVRINATDHTDVSTAMAAHYCDRADLRAANPLAVTCIGAGKVAATSVAGSLQDHVHERTTPQAAAPGRIGTDVLACLRDQGVVRSAPKGRVRMRLGLRARLGDPN